MSSTKLTSRPTIHHRPLGVRLLAIGYLGFALLLAVSLVMLFPSFWWLGAGAIIGWAVPRVIVVGGCLWTAQGLWAQEQRAWYSALVLQCLSILWIGSGLVPLDLLGRLVSALVPVSACIYLWLPHVRRTFRAFTNQQPDR